jgi:Flp pilus assembly protein TadD
LALRKEDLVWQGTVVLANDREQRLNVTLRVSPEKPAVTVASSAAATSQFDVVLRSGIESYKQGWYGPASGRFKHATSLNPLSVVAHLWLGRALIEVQRYDEARRALDMVLTLQKSGRMADEAAALLLRLQ